MGDTIAPTRYVPVFISNTKQDEAVADYLQSALNKAGYRASTMTTSVPAGDRWISSITQSLETADVVVILLSRAAMESSWIVYEIGAAVASVEKSSYKRVIPVALDKDLKPSGVLAQYQWIITSGDPNEVADLVLQALREPRVTDKARERAEAWRSLAQAQSALDLEQKQMEAATVAWVSRATLFLTIASLLAVLAIVVSVVVLTGVSASDATAIASASAALFTGILGYIAGRAVKGVSDGRPRK